MFIPLRTHHLQGLLPRLKERSIKTILHQNPNLHLKFEQMEECSKNTQQKASYITHFKVWMEDQENGSLTQNWIWFLDKLQKTLTFFIFPNEHKKNMFVSDVIIKSVTKSKAHLKVLIAIRILRTLNLSKILQALCAKEQETIWYINSTFSVHIIGKMYFLCEYKLSAKCRYVTFRNNRNCIIRANDILTNRNFTISNVAYVARLKKN